MKAIKIKDMYCWCPAGLEIKADNKRDTGVLSGSQVSAGVVEQPGLLMVMLSDLGQGFPSSSPGFEFIPENTLHTVPCSRFYP